VHGRQDRCTGCCSPGCPGGQQLQDEVRQKEVGALGRREGQLCLLPGSAASELINTRVGPESKLGIHSQES